MIKNILHLCLGFMLLCAFNDATYAHPTLEKVRVGKQADDVVRLVLELTEKAEIKTKKSDDGSLMITVINTKAGPHAQAIEVHGLLKHIDLINNTANVELHVKSWGKLHVKKSFWIAPHGLIHRHRCVIDLTPHVTPEEKRQKIIVIDPGHGGIDPGAIGKEGTREKDITLAAAKELKQALEKDGHYKVHLTREHDVFIQLRDRVAKARRWKADLFISLHADSAPSALAEGVSVYTLSRVASDKVAERLAAEQNKVDLMVGIDLSKEPPEVANILLDLVKREVMNMSGKFAQLLIGSVHTYVPIMSNTHRFANFAVLRALNHPAILIELGFLSNRREEKLLNNPEHRAKIVRGIIEAVDAFFENPKL